MNTDMNAVRLLGAAQLLVFAASLVSDRLLESAVGAGDTSSMLASVAGNLPRLRLSNLAAWGNSLAIVLLAALFYVVLHEQNKIVALVALGCFVAEAIALAVSKIGAHALIPLSQEFVAAGAPEASTYQTLGEFLCHGVDRVGYNIHMLFFCAGGILWYSLLVSSRLIPRAVSIWGLVAVCLLAIPIVMVLYDRNLTQLLVLGLPYAPFEVVLGITLLVKGFL